MLKTRASQFSKMEQAERMEQKYLTWMSDAEQKEDFDSAEKWENMYFDLHEAITAIVYKDATKKHWEIFNHAVGERDRLDVELEIRSI